MGHIMIGIVPAIGDTFVAGALPGSPNLRGAVYGIAPWLLAQAVLMPLMGMPLYSGSMMMAGGSLVGHLLYGASVGRALWFRSAGLPTLPARPRP